MVEARMMQVKSSPEPIFPTSKREGDVKEASMGIGLSIPAQSYDRSHLLALSASPLSATSIPDQPRLMRFSPILTCEPGKPNTSSPFTTVGEAVEQEIKGTRPDVPRLSANGDDAAMEVYIMPRRGTLNASAAEFVPFSLPTITSYGGRTLEEGQIDERRKSDLPLPGIDREVYALPRKPTHSALPANLPKWAREDYSPGSDTAPLSDEANGPGILDQAPPSISVRPVVETKFIDPFRRGSLNTTGNIICEPIAPDAPEPRRSSLSPSTAPWTRKKSLGGHHPTPVNGPPRSSPSFQAFSFSRTAAPPASLTPRIPMSVSSMDSWGADEYFLGPGGGRGSYGSAARVPRRPSYVAENGMGLLGAVPMQGEIVMGGERKNSGLQVDIEEMAGMGGGNWRPVRRVSDDCFGR